MINLKKIPTKPGVYIYRNSKGDIIYIGKAINLKKRVSQYWERDDALGPKTKVLISQVASIETKIVTSEIQALVLEASLIKKYRPKYNSLLKDDKSYLYITISRGQIPIVSTARSSNLPQHSDIFGPLTPFSSPFVTFFPSALPSAILSLSVFTVTSIFAPAKTLIPKLIVKLLTKLNKSFAVAFTFSKNNLKKKCSNYPPPKITKQP